jgi:hypothetical protein
MAMPDRLADISNPISPSVFSIVFLELDGEIGSIPAFFAFIFAFMIVGNWISFKINPRPPLDRYARKGLPMVAFWNVFSSSKWTPEALRYHKKGCAFAFCALLAFLTGYFFLDLVF